jgi:16S rRNA (guanine966-N2)-methyltransferase
VKAAGIRIIAGTLKGRRLETPNWEGLRPTSDRLRETLFNVLAPRIAGARFLDAFAGTGAVGIEALSRGAAAVTFVEQDRRALRLIEGNLERCGVKDRYAIIRAGFAEFSPNEAGAPVLSEAGAVAPAESKGFDLLFLDPPYGQAELVESLEAAAPLVGPGSLLVIEHAWRDEAPVEVSGLRRTRQLRSGDSALSFYDRHPDV